MISNQRGHELRIKLIFKDLLKVKPSLYYKKYPVSFQNSNPKTAFIETRARKRQNLKCGDL